MAKFSYAPLPPRGFRKLSNGILVQRHRVPPPDGHQQHLAPSKLPPLELSRRQPALLVAATLCSDPQAMTTQLLVSYTSLTAFCVIHLTHAIKGRFLHVIPSCLHLIIYYHRLLIVPSTLTTSKQIAHITNCSTCQQDRGLGAKSEGGALGGGRARQSLKPLAQHHLGKLEVVDLAVPIYVCLAYDGINLLVRQLLAQIVQDQAQLGA